MSVTVSVGACRCPGTPHAEDEVFLADKLTVPMGVAAVAALKQSANMLAAHAAITEVYLGQAIVGWSFVRLDGKGKPEPEPITPESIERLIPWPDGGYEVAERAAGLYSEDLFRPLAPKLPRSSSNGRTVNETSATSESGPKRQKRSRPSSLNGSAGKPYVAPAP